MEIEIKMKKEIPTWKWFKKYVTKLDYLYNLVEDKEGDKEEDNNLRTRYFNNLIYISEVYYNVNYNLEIVLLNKEEIKKKSLNKRIGVIYNNIQNLIKIIEKKNKEYIPETKQERRAYNIVNNRFKSVKLTIQKYFMEEELKNKESEEKEQKEEKVRIKRDKLNPNHIRFEYY
jgi:hypothetical protein